MEPLENFLNRAAGKERVLLPDKSALMAPTDDEPPALVSVAFASVPKERTVHAGVPGHFIAWGKNENIDVDFDIMPLRAWFKEGEDWVILWLESRGEQHNLIGLPVSKLAAWKAPSGMVDEIGLLGSIKVEKESLLGAEELRDSATHNFKQMVNAMIPHLLTFSKCGIKNLSQLSAHASQRFSKNVVTSFDMAILRERKAAKAKGKYSGDDAVSVEGGEAAAKRLEALKVQCLKAKQFYDVPIEERIVFIRTDQDGKVTDEYLAAAKAKCEKQQKTHKSKEELIKKVEEVAGKINEGSANSMLVASEKLASPFSALLQAPPDAVAGARPRRQLSPRRTLESEQAAEQAEKEARAGTSNHGRKAGAGKVTHPPPAEEDDSLSDDDEPQVVETVAPKGGPKKQKVATAMYTALKIKLDTLEKEKAKKTAAFVTQFSTLKKECDAAVAELARSQAKLADNTRELDTLQATMKLKVENAELKSRSQAALVMLHQANKLGWSAQTGDGVSTPAGPSGAGATVLPGFFQPFEDFFKT